MNNTLNERTPFAVFYEEYNTLSVRTINTIWPFVQRNGGKLTQKVTQSLLNEIRAKRIKHAGALVLREMESFYQDVFGAE